MGIAPGGCNCLDHDVLGRVTHPLVQAHDSTDSAKVESCAAGGGWWVLIVGVGRHGGWEWVLEAEV